VGHSPGRVLVTQEEIAERVRELGQALSRDYAGKDPLLVGVLKGAVVFLADLMRVVDIPLAADFIGVSSYGGSSRSSGVVKITADLSISIEDRHVVIERIGARDEMARALEQILQSQQGPYALVERVLVSDHGRPAKVWRILSDLRGADKFMQGSGPIAGSGGAAPAPACAVR